MTKRYIGKTALLLAVLGCFLLCAPWAATADQRLAGSSASGPLGALKEMERENWNTAVSAARRSRDPVALKLVTWGYLMEDDLPATFEMASKFVTANPHWPYIYKIERKAEEAMPDTLRPYEVVEWFDAHPPRTADGLSRYTAALLKTGSTAATRAKLAKLWPDTALTTKELRAYMGRYGKLIADKAHAARIDSLIWDGRYGEAEAMLDYVDTPTRLLAEARIKLGDNRHGVDDAIRRVPDSHRLDAGLQFERLRWRRRHDMDTGAIELLNSAPADLVNPAAWWQERHILIRRALEDRKYGLAYTLAAHHRQEDGFAFAQAEWLTGWLALRFANDPAAAYKRFENLFANVGTPISLARASYWAGRAADALDKHESAERWYKIASKFPTTFYGQLAIVRLGASDYRAAFSFPQPGADSIKAFLARDTVRAVRLLHAAGMHDATGPFFARLMSDAKTPEDFIMTAQFARKLGYPHQGVIASKKLFNSDRYALFEHGYPLLGDKVRTNRPEKALVHALIRQESNFDKTAISPASARGLMQLMPATAREVARKRGKRISTDQLTREEALNIELGSAYLQELLERYDNDYVMAIAAYNAGPGRVNRWIRQFGDPRDRNVDVIDWIEMLPIYETRNYVQRVLEGMYVYQLRLSQTPQTLLALK